MRNKKTRYLAWMVRLWQEDGEKSWRIMLEDVHNGKKIGFAGVEQLIEHFSGTLLPDPTNQPSIQPIDNEGTEP